MKKLFILLLFVMCSCQYLDKVKPYIEMVQPTNEEEIQGMANIIVKTIQLKNSVKEIDNIKVILGRVNKNLRLEGNIITIPKIFDIPGLSEKNKLRVAILIDLIELKYGKATIKTPEEYKGILELIVRVNNNL